MMRKRYLQQIENLKSDTPPPREFDLRYSDDKAERLFNMGELSKTKYNEHGKKPLAEIGDWNCSYCDWKGVCYPQGIFTIDVEDGVLTIDEALANYSVGE
jgi:ribosomal protein S8